MSKPRGSRPSGGGGRGRGRAAGKPRRGAEVAGALLVLVAAFALVSLVSYDPNDPSTAVATDQSVRNFAGRVGAAIADALIRWLGLAAFVLPFAVGWIALRIIVPPPSGRFALRAAALILWLVVLCPFLQLAFLRGFAWNGRPVQAGGLVGYGLFEMLHAGLNTWGTALVLLGALALLTLFSTRWSLARTLRGLRKAFQSTVKDVRIRVVRYRKERDKERRRRRVVEKYARPAAPAKPARAAAPDEVDEAEVSDKARRRHERDMEKERKRQEKESAREEKRKARDRAKAPKPAKRADPEPMLLPDLRRRGDYQFPPFGLLDPGTPAEKVDKAELYEKKQRIEQKLKEFGVEGEVREYHPGPVITTYEFFPAPGIKISQVANLNEEISLALEAESVRIQRLPGKASLGLEIPNNKRETIKLRDILQSEKFLHGSAVLPFAIGKDVHGEPYVTDISVMPHLLIAGATGTGKSVGLNTLLASLLYKATPDELKLILIDPKHVEFTLFEDIPHLMAPIVSDAKKASGVLLDVVKKMEERLRTLGRAKARNIAQYNQLVKAAAAEKKGRLTEEEAKALEPMPYIVVVIDELADLMMVGAQDVEHCITRLAQLARATGIHLVFATQRPSVDILTGTIKANFPCRVSFRVAQKIDSRIILDQLGAEHLLGKGDLLFIPPNFPRVVRLHGAYVTHEEVGRLVKHVKSQGIPEYDARLVDAIRSEDGAFGGDDEKDEMFDQAVEVILRGGQASASHLQRRLRLGYARAGRLIDQMYREGILGPPEGSKPREILVDPVTYLREREKRRGSPREE